LEISVSALKDADFGLACSCIYQLRGWCRFAWI